MSRPASAKKAQAVQRRVVRRPIVVILSYFPSYGTGIVIHVEATVATAVNRIWFGSLGVRGFMAAASLLLASDFASAQTVSNTTVDPYTDLSQYLVDGGQVVPRQSVAPAPIGANLSSTVVQAGLNNSASATLNGIANTTSQIQNGSNNASSLSLNGTQNAVATTQIGNSNTTTIGINGSNNEISNTQIGSGLSYQIQVTGTAAPITITQFGHK